ncbi:MAG: RDD family protein [Burkholderiales bacterium]
MADAAYGGFWIRVLAYWADMSILFLVLLALAVPFTFMGGAGMGLFGLVAAFGPIAYFVWFTASDRQATFGKQLCGLKVQHAGSDEGISLLRSLGRELAKVVSGAILMIGFLLVAFTGRKQGLHDMLASTEVVREGPARIVPAILVALAGVVIPAIVIPIMFAGMFAGLMAMMMGGAMGEMEVKQTKPAPQMEQKAAPRPQASTAQPAPKAATTAPTAPAVKPAAAAEAAKSAPVEPAKPAPVEPAKPAAIDLPKPVAAAAPAVKPAPPEPAAQPRTAPSRREAAPAKPAAEVLLQGRSPCIYKPVMTDEEIARCR